MHLLSVVLVSLLPTLSTAAPQVTSTPPATDAFTPPAVVSVSFSGSGCPQGTTDAPDSSLWENFTFDLPSFKAKIGPSSTVAERTVNCQAHVNLRSSTAGWQFALKDHWSRGYFENNGAGATLTQYLTVYFSQDAADTATAARSIPSSNSTVSKSLDLHTSIPEPALVWSPCGGSSILNVNFRMAFTGAASGAAAYYGPGKSWPVSERWGWTWRRC
ncbi:putative secreted protein [Rosellinia necatrix]|uniref:Putative secreted protein n=1 Tax=Rosellinia necatrix TaxID=77044 RepID=A0A1W2TXN6_ROSNE|nr:putative secreted protein [Rosellinia necatrix]